MMKKHLVLFLKGIIIGIGKIIPGVSGAMLAISLGVYEKMISSVANIFTETKRNLRFLLMIGSGMLVAIMVSSNLIMYFLNNYYLTTMLLFIGMIIGCLPDIIKITKKSVTKKNVVLLLLPFILLLLIGLFSNSQFHIKTNFFTLILIGIIEAITMIIPGISGSAVLMLLGVYEEIINSLSSFHNLGTVIPFGIGITIGILTLSKLINKFFQKYNISCYYVILGFTIASIFVLLGNVFSISYSLIDILKGIIFLIVGVFISYKLS
jgi:putative membrane protein